MVGVGVAEGDACYGTVNLTADPPSKEEKPSDGSLKNRGPQDVLMPVCDGLKGLPDAARNGLASNRLFRPA